MSDDATDLDRRKRLISKIGEKRNSKVITYILSDRPSGGPSVDLNLAMEPTALSWIHDALRSVGVSNQVDLFVYTRGGAIDIVWPIVSLIREYAKDRFCAIIPFKAHSAGTLLCMAADNIIMGKAAEMTSVDPTTGNAFNPADEIEQGKRKGISVEDLTAYFAFLRENEKVKLNEPEHIFAAFTQLTNQLHPIALGHVQRVHTQIRFLAEKLLNSHKEPIEEEAAKSVVKTLTEKLYSHTQAINRNDARDLFGDCIVFPDEEEELLIWTLFEEYSEALQLKTPQNILSDLGGAQRATHSYYRGFIESEEYSAAFESKIDFTAASVQMKDAIYNQAASQVMADMQPSEPGLPTYIPGLPATFGMSVLFEGWRENTEGV